MHIRPRLAPYDAQSAPRGSRNPPVRLPDAAGDPGTLAWARIEGHNGTELTGRLTDGEADRTAA